MKRSRPIYLRQWRRHRGLTQELLADRLGISQSLLSRIETGKVPWDQHLLEIAAEALMCDPVDLLIRNPEAPEGIWSIWEQASEGERTQIVRLAKAIVGDKAG